MREVIRQMVEFAEDIYRHPELGFKEFRTSEKVKELLSAHGIPFQECAYTGLTATLDSQKAGPHIGLIAELDAIPVFGHPFANSEDHAAHACGHYAQLGVMLSVFLALKEKKELDRLCGKVTLVCTPAEEFCDLDYRKSLIEQGIIHHCSGKQEMISLGVFDTMDAILSCHTMGIDMKRYHAEIGSSLNGFLSKKAVFYGKSSHAGGNPAGGVNALNASTLAMTGINFLRETFREEDTIRVHFISTEGGQAVNTIPARTVLEMYVRAGTIDAILETNEKVDRALRAGALAIGCDLDIINTPGYVPLRQDEALTAFVAERMKRYMPETMIACGTHGFASGDMGDISLLFPTVEIGIAGFEGSMHGADFKTADEEQAYFIPARYFYDSVVELLSDGGAAAFQIKKSFMPRMTKEEYLDMLHDFNKTTRYPKEE